MHLSLDIAAHAHRARDAAVRAIAARSRGRGAREAAASYVNNKALTTFKLLDYRQSSGRYEVMAFRSVDPGVRGIWGARGK